MLLENKCNKNEEEISKISITNPQIMKARLRNELYKIYDKFSQFRTVNALITSFQTNYFLINYYFYSKSH